jgi:hypothetical protein
MNNQQKFQSYIDDINAGIDAVRADLWDTAALPELRQPVDNYAKAHQRQADRAIIWDGIMSYRDGSLDYQSLFELLYSYDPTITADDVTTLTGRYFNV